MDTRWILFTLGIIILVVLFQQYKPLYTPPPKIIWTHWDSENPPKHVQKTVERMRKIMPDWDVRFITTEQYLRTVPREMIPENFYGKRVEHQADWIRLKLLQTYGGCWMDSGIIVNKSINSLYRECVVAKADLLVFKNVALQTNPKYPVAENWFIMAPPQSPIISAWLEEYERSIIMGFRPYKKSIKDDGVDLQNLMKSPGDVYLTQHGCFQKVIQQRMPPGTKIVYHVAEDTMFKIHAKDCGWDQSCISKKLQDVKYCRTIPYIKLRGADRKDIDIMPLYD